MLFTQSEGFRVVEAAVKALPGPESEKFWAFTQAPIYGTEKNALLPRPTILAPPPFHSPQI